MVNAAVLFVRSATHDPSPEPSRRAQEEAGRRYAEREGLRITRVWEAEGKAARDPRRSLRAFARYVSANPALQALLFEKPERFSRSFRDWVWLLERCRTGGPEIRFFGSSQSPESDAMGIDLALAFCRRGLDTRPRHPRAT